MIFEKSLFMIAPCFSIGSKIIGKTKGAEHQNINNKRNIPVLCTSPNHGYNIYYKYLAALPDLVIQTGLPQFIQQTFAKCKKENPKTQRFVKLHINNDLVLKQNLAINFIITAKHAKVRKNFCVSLLPKVFGIAVYLY